MEKVGALILAAGLSSRMGKFKPMLPLGGDTIIRQGISRLKEAGCQPIVVVTGRDHELLEESISDLDVTCIFNPEFSSCQMFDSAKLGFEALKGKCQRFFFTPADVCAYKTSSLKALLAWDKELVRPVFSGKTGHPVLIRESLIEGFLKGDFQFGLKSALEEIIDRLDLEVDDEGILMDADTMEDYQALVKYWEREFGK